ncbi:GcrA family cell cycle regulator [uncultured Enterovirga sp.]|uniref:GcrA family cell cycle regulator n=1 Tax=uncultured Enterovirga sp. TaxID=2026352 RepID=UPI0035CC9AA5
MSFDWTKARVELLRRMWCDEGCSARQVAEALGPDVTRNAVLGQVHRRGFRAAGVTARAPRREPSTATAMRSAAIAKPGGEPPPAVVALPPPPLPPPPVLVPRGPRPTIFDLDRPEIQTMCRFIADEVKGPAETRYCGQRTTAPGNPYCQMHQDRCWTSSHPKARRAPLLSQPGPHERSSRRHLRSEPPRGH